MIAVMPTRISAFLALLLSGAVLAGCGGSSHSSTSKTTSLKASQPPSAAAEPQVNQAQSKSPLAAHTSAQVSEVSLTSPTTATVTYTILLAGKPALKNVKGTAVKTDGKWQVGDQSFCQLLKLQGTTPPGCPKA